MNTWNTRLFKDNLTQLTYYAFKVTLFWQHEKAKVQLKLGYFLQSLS